MDNLLHIQVACAWPEQQIIRDLQVKPGTTAAEALALSGLLQHMPQHILLKELTLGIFGRIIKPDQVLAEGDRVEIYRPLLLDPKEARRQRAQRTRRR